MPMAKRGSDEVYNTYIEMVNTLYASKCDRVYCGALLAVFLMRGKHAIFPCGDMSKDEQDKYGLHNVVTLVYKDKPIDIYVSRSMKIDDRGLYTNKGEALHTLQFDSVELV